jgi:ribosomal subunit interface protein
MRIKIIGGNIDVTPRIKRLVQNKIARNLEKYLPKLNQEIKTATIKIEKHTRWGYKVNFDMWLPEKYQIFAESRKENLRSALVDLKRQLERQIKKYKASLKPI